ncbi:MAG: hypothetical protein Q7R47_04315, partial [Candidatus Diapherotrites archaeon]|nr:hypothetical protein [Candidatus Diapherotrites archaeon]
MLVFGCASDPTALSKNFAQAKDFLAAHPNASVTVTVFKTADFDADQNFWDAQCDLNVSDIDLFKAVYEDANDRLTLLFSKDGATVMCQFTEQLDAVPPDQNTADQNSPVPDLNAPVPPLDQNVRVPCDLSWDCASWTACDANHQTRDCTLKANCIDDQNRPSISRSCVMPFVGRTCDDLNGSACSSSQKCTAALVSTDVVGCCAQCVLKTCLEMSGTLCDANHSCSVSKITTSDTNYCCAGTCTAINPCAGVTCSDSNKTCVAGTCVQKTCSQLSGSVCASGTVCSTATVDSNGSSACCTGT